MNTKKDRLRACISHAKGFTYGEQVDNVSALLGLSKGTIEVYLSPSRDISDHAIELLEYKLGVRRYEA